MAVEPVRVCFVCLGNICRSPAAAGVMRALVDAAGLSEALERVPAAPCLVARQIHPDDFTAFDYVLAMDRSNRHRLEMLAPSGARAFVGLLRDFEPGAPPDAEVPDPYYGDADHFREVFDLCERACAGLLAHLRARHGV